MSISSIESGRADKAFQFVKLASEESYKKKYKSHVKNFPMLIKTNGLGATLAFAFSKKNEADYKCILQNITDWLSVQQIIIMDRKTPEELIKKIVSMNSSEYRAVTVEVIALLSWMKRFSQGLIEE